MCDLHVPMKTPDKFIPLSLLIPSLYNAPRLYHLYRNAAASGDRGAWLRFRSFRQSRPRNLIRRIEQAFGLP